MMPDWISTLLGRARRNFRSPLDRDAILALLEGKSVAIIGNARALSQCAYGEEIDQADIVIRINSAPIHTTQSHGARTDWLAVSTPVSKEIMEARAPSVILWMSPNRKRLPRRMALQPGFFLNPVEAWQTLRDQVAERPTTGLMLIDLVAASKASAITLFGFDFFASLSLSGRREAKDVPHDFASEQEWVMDLIARDPRVSLRTMGPQAPKSA